jgi:hypothetical protein
VGGNGAGAPTVRDNLLSENPGAGAGCEGEDVMQISQLGAVGAMTAHIYWRWARAFHTHKFGTTKGLLRGALGAKYGASLQCDNAFF